MLTPVIPDTPQQVRSLRPVPQYPRLAVAAQMLRLRLLSAVILLARDTCVDERVEQTMCQLAGCDEAAVQVDSADDGLEGIGQDGGLVPSAPLFFIVAELRGALVSSRRCRGLTRSFPTSAGS